MIYGFCDFELDTQRYELRRAGEPCKVEPKAFDLLVYLIQNRDRAVTRDELFERVWGGEAVSDAVLSHHVMVFWPSLACLRFRPIMPSTLCRLQWRCASVFVLPMPTLRYDSRPTIQSAKGCIPARSQSDI